jgi:cell division protein YceG involved in septum cleavage
MSQSKFFLTSRRRFFYNAGVGAGVLLVSSMILSLYLLSAPRTHADGALFLVTPELSEHDAIEKLSREGYIRNASAFALLWNTVYTGGAIVPGGYVLSKDMNAREIARTITEPPQQRWVTLKEGMTRAEAALAFARSLEWNEAQRREFSSTLVSMQWDFFNEDARRLFTTRLNWDALEQEIFTTMATLYRAAEYDFFSGTLPPGDYLVPIAESIPRITNQFLHTMREIVAPSAHAYFSEHIDASITENSRTASRSDPTTC